MALEPFRISLLILLYFITGCSCGDFCYYYSYSYGGTTFYYCGTGCCGYYYSRECCSNIGTIAGSIVGGVVVVAIVIGIIVCCVITHKHQQKRIKQRQQRQAGIVTIVHTGGVQHHEMPYSHPPPDYSPFGPAAGGPMGGNPAYPPPSTYGQPHGMPMTTGGMMTTAHMDPPPYK
ncbi:unnamed protein product [Mytilus coruscus]|uniref:Cysteine and tyrosine-rich protein 1 n=1 Tax=Mytilus coruscus TaxID=42192 RepID=A0A6J8CUB0_MYTCO|nr:unnamed protein product [Mytilus coruscus]